MLPLAVEELLITGVGGFTVRVSVAEPVPLAFVAPIVTVEVPTALGVPVMLPVNVLTVSPDGNPLAL